MRRSHHRCPGRRRLPAVRCADRGAAAVKTARPLFANQRLAAVGVPPCPPPRPGRRHWAGHGHAGGAERTGLAGGTLCVLPLTTVLGVRPTQAAPHRPVGPETAVRGLQDRSALRISLMVPGPWPGDTAVSRGFRRGRRGHDHLVSVSMFDHRPRRCPYGHDVGPGKAKVSWTPCGCDPALEANERGRGLGHITVTCGTCWDERRVTRFYEPPHDTSHPTAR